MGCGGSVPKADVFLANEQPPPSQGYLHDAMPSEGLTIPTWHFEPGKHYHSGGGVFGGLQTLGVLFDQHVDDNHAFYNGSTLEDVVGNGGTGEAFALPITASGATVATMKMPPHMAFGIPVVLRDTSGQVIAIIATAQTSRPSPMSKTTINVYGTKPIAGQAPTVLGGANVYLWARADRKGFSNNKFTFYDAANQEIAKGESIRGFQLQYKIMASNGDGLMLASFAPGSGKKTFDLQVAKGVDATLAICMLGAMQLGADELKVDPDTGTGGNDDD